MLEFIVEVLFEFLFQLVVEVLVELGLHSVSEANRKPFGPVLAAVGYALAGAILGALSLLMLPSHLVANPWRIANLIGTPIAVGGAMVGMGALRARHGDEVLRIDRFAYGYVFALCFALIRFYFAK
jgi:hypothetical protein